MSEGKANYNAVSAGTQSNVLVFTGINGRDPVAVTAALIHSVAVNENGITIIRCIGSNPCVPVSDNFDEVIMKINAVKKEC